MERHEEQAEILSRLSIHLAVDIEEIVRVARDQASSVRHRGLAPGLFHPESQDGFDFAYVAEHVVDVPSDGEYHGVTLRRQRGPMTMKHVAVPRESADVYRVIEITNPLDAPLLPGPLDLSVEGEFRVTTSVPTVPARGSFEIGAGVEPAIRVARNTRFEEEATGFTRAHLELKHEITIDAINHLTRAVRFEVRERIPVTAEGERHARIHLLEVSPGWEEREGARDVARGTYSWILSLDPGEARKLTARYSIQIAAKHELTGGNRREF